MHTGVSILKYLIIAILIVTCATPVQAKDFVVVLDPGHGGHDPGTHGKSAKEKDIVLTVSNKVKSLLAKHKDIKAMATRSTDCYVTLDSRAYKANKAMCDLFVSIHCNSVKESNPRRHTINGVSVYSMSKDRSTENLEIVKKENSVVELDKLYAPNEQKFASDELAILSELNQTNNIHHSVLAANIIQKELIESAGRHDLGTKKAGFLVLRKLTRPTVLVEIDYLCNPSVEKFLASAAGQEKVAEAIYNGIIEYKNAQETDTGARPEPKKEKASDNNSREDYRIQILTSSTPIKDGSKRFKGLGPIDSYKEGNVIKYTYGHFPSQSAAAAEMKKNIKPLFKDAFVVKFKNGKRIK